jgi:hypothetical protein
MRRQQVVACLATEVLLLLLMLLMLLMLLLLLLFLQSLQVLNARLHFSASKRSVACCNARPFLCQPNGVVERGIGFDVKTGIGSDGKVDAGVRSELNKKLTRGGSGTLR